MSVSIRPPVPPTRGRRVGRLKVARGRAGAKHPRRMRASSALGRKINDTRVDFFMANPVVTGRIQAGAPAASSHPARRAGSERGAPRTRCL